MKSRIFNNGGWVYIDSDTAKGWHHCATADEFFAYQAEYKGELDDELVMWKGAKIPEELFAKCLALVKAFPDTEVSIILLYNKDKKEWMAKIPQQRGSGGHVEYKDEEDNPQGYYFFGTIHSHPNMSAFWSSIDMADQAKKPGIHIVVGTDHGTAKEILCSLFINGQRYDQKEVFEMPDIDKLPEADQDWVDKIKNSPVVINKETKPDLAERHLVKYKLDEHLDFHLEDDFNSDWCKLQAILDTLEDMGEPEVADYVASKLCPKMDPYASDADLYSDSELWQYDADGQPYYESDGKEYGL